MHVTHKLIYVTTDHADVLLQKAFLVGTTTSIETNTYITEALQTLNLETTLITNKLDS